MFLADDLNKIGLERIRGGGVDGSYPGLPGPSDGNRSMHSSEVLACWTAAGWGFLCPYGLRFFRFDAKFIEAGSIPCPLKSVS